jgi:hypothetical protein
MAACHASRPPALLNVPLLYTIITSHHTSDFPTPALSSYISAHFTLTIIEELSPSTFLDDRNHAFSPCFQAAATKATKAKAGAPQGPRPNP